jgi:type IV secretory pathway protease TraF
MYGYYACNDVGRDDLVIVYNAGNPAPLIKIAKGIPGDTFRMDPKDDAWHYLVIDGRNATNSRGEQYLIDERGYALLSLYYNDDKGVMPPDTYLLLGNIATGTFDSTRFGLIGRADILGKAIVVQNATNDAATDAVPEPAAGAGQFFPGMS